MASTAVELPSEYGYVVLVLVFYFILYMWMGLQVANARKKYKVFYPTMYAVESENKEAKLFNWVQRAHQHSLELMPVFFVMVLVGGIQHPLISAALGVVYIVSRFFYFRDYSTGVPEHRLKFGGSNLLALMGLVLCAASFGIHLIIRDVL